LANPIVEPALMQELCRERATYPLLGEWGPTQQLADERRYYAYDHAMVPNSISCTDRSTPLDNTRVELPAAATSAHGGGVNLLMCDGSVSFVSESIAVNVWWAKGTADGAETTGVD
jgi:prepilin-type processing-associated H-X9-DG protein